MEADRGRPTNDGERDGADPQGQAPKDLDPQPAAETRDTVEGRHTVDTEVTGDTADRTEDDTPDTDSTERGHEDAGEDNRRGAASGWHEVTADVTPANIPRSAGSVSMDTRFPTRTRLLAAILLVVLLAAAVAGWVLMRAGTDSATNSQPQEISADAFAGAPVPVRPDSTYTLVTVTQTGDLEVDQWISSTNFVFGVSLATPTDPLLPPGTVRATGIRVVADDTAVSGPAELVDGFATYPLAGARHIHLSYRLSGVLERSDTKPGRALARVTSLDVSFQPRSQRSTVAFVGATLLSLACEAEYVDGTPTPCGVRRGDGWKVDLPTDSQGYLVMAQLDLTRALG